MRWPLSLATPSTKHFMDPKIKAQWERDGYLVIENLFSRTEAKDYWADIQHHLVQNNLNPMTEFNSSGSSDRITGCETIDSLTSALSCNRLKVVLTTILGPKYILQDLMALLKSSGAPPHTESIYLTTFPKFRSVRIWIAMEDIKDDAGPLCLYPGTHRRPAISPSQLGVARGLSNPQLWIEYRRHYLPYMKNILTQGNYPSIALNVKVGTTILMHPNLIHEGIAAKDRELTRKALVGSFVAKDVLLYSDLSGKVLTEWT